MRVLRSDGKLKVDAGIVTGAQPIALSAGTQSASTGTILFQNSNSISFGMSNSSIITASVDAVFRAGVSTGGNTTGDTRVTGGQIVFQGSNNITLSQITGAGNANTVVISASSGGASVDASWNFDTSTVAADPGNKKFRLNNATLASVTEIYVNDTTNQGFDIGQIASFLASGMRIYIQQKNDSTRAALFQVTGAATDNTGWWTIPVSVVNSGTIYQANADCAFVFVLSAAGASANITAFATSNTTQSSTGILSTNSMIFAGAGGVSVGISNGSVVISGGGGAPFGISAGTQSVSTGTMVFSNSNNISFGMSGSSRITASIDGVMSVSAGTTRATNGEVVFSNSNNVSFGINGNTVTASVTIATSLTNINVSAGTTSNNLSAMVFSNSNNVSFGLNGSTITATITVPPETPFGVSAGTQSVSTGTLVFSNSNNVTFGMSGSSRITASFSTLPETPFGVSAGTQSVSTGTMIFANSNSITFGMSGSSQITASFSTLPETPFGISAGTQSASTGTMIFSNSNNFTFGMSGSSRITVSYTAPVVSNALQSVGSATGSGTNTSRFAADDHVHAGVFSMGVSTAGNTIGNTRVDVGQFVFQGGANVTLSQITAINALNTILISAAAGGGGGMGISAGTQSVSTGTMIFANSNFVTFGMSGSSQITASYTAPVVSNAIQAVGSATGSGTNTSRFAADDHVHAGVFSMGASTAGNTLGDTRVGAGQFVIQGGPNITVSQITAAGALNTIVLSGGAGAAGNTGSLSAGTTRGTLGEIVFANSNGVSFGMNGQTMTGSVATSLTNINVSAGTTSNNLSAMVFSNSNNVSFGMNGSTVTATITVPPETPFGISAGTQSVSTGTMVFSDSNGISFGMSGSSRITASYTVPTVMGISAGTQSVNTGTVVFSNSNNVTFGMSGSSRITASFSETPFGISAGTQSVSTGTMIFANSNSITFGMSGSSQITASFSTAPETPFGVSAGTQSVSTGTLVFSNSNNITFGMSGSSRITASFSTLPETPFGISAGTQSVSTGTMVFSNSNGISFGMSNSNAITASFTRNVASNAIQSVGSATGSGTNTSRFAADDHVHAGVFSMGVSTGGNTANQTRVDVGRFVFEGGNNVTLSQVTAAGALNTIVISAGGGAGGGNINAFATSNTTQSSTGVLSTASMIFAGAGGVSVGISNGSVVISGGAGGGGAFSAGISTQGNTAGTTGFIGSQIQFVGSGPMSLSQSVNGQSATLSIIGPATSSLSATGIVSISVNASTISIGAPLGGGITLEGFMPAGLMDALWVTTVAGQSTVMVEPMDVPLAFKFDRVLQPIFMTATSNLSGSHTLSFHVGIFTRNGSTLSLLSSTSTTYALTHSGTAGSYSRWSGLRFMSIPWTGTLTAGNYWMAFLSRTTTAGAGGASYSQMALSRLNSNIVGHFNTAALTLGIQFPEGLGTYNAGVSTMPGSMGFSDLRGTASQAIRPLVYYFASDTHNAVA